MVEQDKTLPLNTQPIKLQEMVLLALFIKPKWLEQVKALLSKKCSKIDDSR